MQLGSRQYCEVIDIAEAGDTSPISERPRTEEVGQTKVGLQTLLDTLSMSGRGSGLAAARRESSDHFYERVV